MPNATVEVMSDKRLLREAHHGQDVYREFAAGARHHGRRRRVMAVARPVISMVSDLMDSDMRYVPLVGAGSSQRPIQYFMGAQLLSGLAHLHACNVVHRDLKPSNLLVDRNCDLRICDFGMARTCAAPNSAAVHDDEQMLTLYVATRWYRAPELLCLSHSYGAAVDLWSTGCILAEMILRAPLMAGNDYLNQLQLIIQTLGTPTDAEMATLENEHARVRAAAARAEGELGGGDAARDAGGARAAAQAARLRPGEAAGRRRRRSTTSTSRRTSRPTTRRGLEQAVQATSADMFDMANVSALPKEQLQNLIFQEMLHFHPEMIAVNCCACAPARRDRSPSVADFSAQKFCFAAANPAGH